MGKTGEEPLSSGDRQHSVTRTQTRRGTLTPSVPGEPQRMSGRQATPLPVRPEEAGDKGNALTNIEAGLTQGKQHIQWCSASEVVRVRTRCPKCHSSTVMVNQAA